MRTLIKGTLAILLLVHINGAFANLQTDTQQATVGSQPVLHFNDSASIVHLRKDGPYGWRNVQLPKNGEKSTSLELGDYQIVVQTKGELFSGKPLVYPFTVNENKPYFLHLSRSDDLNYLTMWVSTTTRSQEGYEKERITRFCVATIFDKDFQRKAEYTETVKQYCEEAIKLGSSEAHVWLGHAHERNFPGFSNFDTAIEHYKRAHEQNNSLGSYYYASALLKRGKISEKSIAMEAMKKAAAQGQIEAKGMMVLLLLQQVKTPKDWDDIKTASEAAIRAEDLAGFYGMADWNIMRDKKKRDFEKAIAWIYAAKINNDNIGAARYINDKYRQAAFELTDEAIVRAKSQYASVIKSVMPVTGEICLISHLHSPKLKGKKLKLHLNGEELDWVDLSKPLLIEGLFLRNLDGHALKIYADGEFATNFKVDFTELNSHRAKVIYDIKTDVEQIIPNDSAENATCVAE